MLVLFGGAAGAGKSTLADVWCKTRPRAAHIQLDEVRSLIVAGLADPRAEGDVQAAQFLLSVRAYCAQAREFDRAGYDVAIDDVLYPGSGFDSSWRIGLADMDWRIVIVHPSLADTLQRSRARAKRVPENLTREQHDLMSEWPALDRIDTTGLTVADSLGLVEAAIRLGPPGPQTLAES